MKDGATIRAYDPASMEESTKLLPGMVPCQDTYDVAEGADGLIIMTEWNQFRNLALRAVEKVHAATTATGSTQYLRYRSGRRLRVPPHLSRSSD